MSSIKLDIDEMNKSGDMSNCYMFKFKTGVVSVENPFLLDLDVREELFDQLVKEFKIELYSKLYKENKTETIIKVHSGVI